MTRTNSNTTTLTGQCPSCSQENTITIPSIAAPDRLQVTCDYCNRTYLLSAYLSEPARRIIAEERAKAAAAEERKAAEKAELAERKRREKQELRKEKQQHAAARKAERAAAEQQRREESAIREQKHREQAAAIEQQRQAERAVRRASAPGCQRCGGQDFKKWRRTSGLGWGLFIAGLLGLLFSFGTLFMFCIPMIIVGAFCTQRGWKCRDCGYSWRE